MNPAHSDSDLQNFLSVQKNLNIGRSTINRAKRALTFDGSLRKSDNYYPRDKSKIKFNSEDLSKRIISRVIKFYSMMSQEFQFRMIPNTFGEE